LIAEAFNLLSALRIFAFRWWAIGKSFFFEGAIGRVCAHEKIYIFTSYVFLPLSLSIRVHLICKTTSIGQNSI
jgi:hypothetical protein